MENGTSTDASSLSPDSHASAAEAFARRVRTDVHEGVEDLVLFGSTARGEADGLASDVDVLAIVSDAADRNAIGDELREIAYDVMLEYGPVVEVHVLTRSEFEERRERGHPFIQNVLGEGRSYA